MTEVNYYVLGALLGILERIELIDEVPFYDFDPDDEKDVATIAQKYIAPAIQFAAPKNREAIMHAIAYYSAYGSAPFQLMKDQCQELTLPDADSWPRFFD